jgi:hypothetical protein
MLSKIKSFNNKKMNHIIFSNYLIVYNILTYYFPNYINITYLNFCECKYVNRTWNIAYKHLFKQIGTKYCIIKYDDYITLETPVIYIK